MVFRPRPNHPYAAAPRFPDGAEVELADLFPREATLVGDPGAQRGSPGEAPPVHAEGPVEIEIGPGRGGFLFERAEAAPEARLLGLEIRLKWSALVDERLRKHGLGVRARVLNADAREALPRLRPDASVARFFLHFPDPWWKKRHTKRLVMGPALLDAIARLLEDGGEVFVQTDVEERAALYAEQLGAHPALEPAGDAPGSPYLAANPYGALSPREHHAVADGLPVTRLRYRRRPR